jgi:hypothetical protein
MRLLLTLSLVGSLISYSAAAQTPVHTPPANLTCPGDAIVWVNTRSGVYHFQGERYFGSTQQGKFMCEKQARAEGDRPTRNGQ